MKPGREQALPSSHFTSLFRSFIVRPLTASHRAGDRMRTALSIVAIALGVGVILAVQLANRSSIGSFENSIQEISGRTNLSISAANGIDEQMIPGLRELAGPSAELSPVLESIAIVQGAGEVLRVIGLDVIQDKAFREMTLQQGNLSQRDSLLMLLDPHALERQGLMHVTYVARNYQLAYWFPHI